jgi:hypothetical protein
MEGSAAYNALPYKLPDDKKFWFLIEVFVDNFMSLVVATTRWQVLHVGHATTMGIHDVFPPDDTLGDNPISEKKMEQGDLQFNTTETLLRFDFDGIEKTIWLAENKWAALLLILKGWIRTGTGAHASIPFNVFELVVAKLRHAFTALQRDSACCHGATKSSRQSHEHYFYTVTWSC